MNPEKKYKSAKPSSISTFVLFFSKNSSLGALKRKFPFIGHVFFWSLYILNIHFVNLLESDDHSSLLDIACLNLIVIWVFYSSYYFWKMGPGDKKWPEALLALLVSSLLFYAGRSIYMYFILPQMGFKPYTSFNSRKFIIDNIFIYVQYFIYGMGYYFSVRSSLKEKQLRKAIEEKRKIEEERFRLEQDNMLLEQQQLQTEYAFLRSQINPHFLQNTLNFFYSKSLTCSEELSSAILTLSEIMRYSLNTKTNETPPLLTEELKQMTNLISINQMRFGNRLQIQYTQTGDTEGIRIIPLVLITLAENAFKHGELGNPEHPMKVQLDISEYQETLSFTVSNLKKTGPKDQSHGIGLENIRRRLQLVYGKEAALNIDETATHYSIALNIKKLHP